MVFNIMANVALRSFLNLLYIPDVFFHFEEVVLNFWLFLFSSNLLPMPLWRFSRLLLSLTQNSLMGSPTCLGDQAKTRRRVMKLKPNRPKFQKLLRKPQVTMRCVEEKAAFFYHCSAWVLVMLSFFSEDSDSWKQYNRYDQKKWNSFRDKGCFIISRYFPILFSCSYCMRFYIYIYNHQFLISQSDLFFRRWYILCRLTFKFLIL